MRNQTFPQLDEIALASTLNPAPRMPLDPTDEIRAEARLQQITASPRETSRRAPNRAPRPSRLLRWAAIPVAAAAAIGIGIALPGGIGAPPARASLLNWTAWNDPLTDAELSAADVVCRDAINASLVDRNASVGRWNETFADNPAVPQMNTVSLLAQPAVAERRGDWGLLGYPQDDGLALCLVWFGAAGPQITMSAGPGLTTVFALLSGPPSGGTAALRGALLPDSDVASTNSLAGDGVYLQQTAEITIPADASVIPPAAGVFTMVGGRVGDDITAVTLHTQTGGDVQAAVENGYWLAWWPGAMGGPDTYHVHRVDGPAGWSEDGTPIYDDGEPVRIWTNPGTAIITGYTTTLSDGSVMVTETNWENCNEAEDCFFDPAAAQARYEEHLQQTG